jgi:hypothetical protein
MIRAKVAGGVAHGAEQREIDAHVDDSRRPEAGVDRPRARPDSAEESMRTASRTTQSADCPTTSAPRRLTLAERRESRPLSIATTSVDAARCAGREPKDNRRQQAQRPT